MMVEQLEQRHLRFLIGSVQLGSAVWDKAVQIESHNPNSDNYAKAKAEVERFFLTEFKVEPKDIHWRTEGM